MTAMQRSTPGAAPVVATHGKAAMVRILIADDHAIVRAGLKQFIAGAGDLQVTGEASSGAETVELVRDGEFDIVLLDIRMPDGSGIDTLRRLKEMRPELSVLMLSGFAEDQYALNLLRAGAAGYVTKEAAPSELVKAIRTVMVGRKYVSPELAQILATGVTGETEKPLHAQLSQREFQIFCKLASGESASKIADELLISVKTVSTYRTRILEKMNLKSNADITYYAIKNGLIQ
jgi:DNA-binding NarL/FixJ family response regulator